MTLQQFKNELEKIGIPVAYRNFKSPQDLPFICYLVKNNNDFNADGINYFKIKYIAVELYCNKKDEQLEEKVENVLDKFNYTKSETYIDTEKMYMILYEMEI